jgi:hypothetical protein
MTLITKKKKKLNLREFIMEKEEPIFAIEVREVMKWDDQFNSPSPNNSKESHFNSSKASLKGLRTRSNLFSVEQWVEVSISRSLMGSHLDSSPSSSSARHPISQILSRICLEQILEDKSIVQDSSPTISIQ